MIMGAELGCVSGLQLGCLIPDAISTAFEKVLCHTLGREQAQPSATELKVSLV